MQRIELLAAGILVLLGSSASCALPLASDGSPGALVMSLAMKEGQPPGEMGLSWKECAVAGGEPDWRQAGACLEDGGPVWDETDHGRNAEATDRGYRLGIGTDVYETAEYPLPWGIYSFYVLSRNGCPQQVFLGQFTTYSPDHSLQNVGGKAVWEYAAAGRETVVADGADAARLYGLDAAYAPYELGGKLIFIGQKGGKRFVIYDGQQAGPAFDEITIAYCCEPAAYTARGGGGRYAFWGARHGQRYAVEISVETGGTQ